jgi:hypothetical protein
LGHKNTAL